MNNIFNEARVRIRQAGVGNFVYKGTLGVFARAIMNSKGVNQKGWVPPRIVICGAFRSGTTLMNEMMACFEGVYVMHVEEQALRFPFLVKSADYIVTKRPRDYLNFNRIVDTFREPFFICMVRDPRDMMVSQHPLYPGKYFSDFSVWEEAIREIEGFPYPRKMVVKYEELIRDADRIQSHMIEALGLRMRCRFTEFHKLVDSSSRHDRIPGGINSLNGVRPVDSANKNKFLLPEHRARITEQLDQFPQISEYLIKYGYEKDRSWENDFHE